MKKELLLTTLISLVALLAFGQITRPKNNRTFVISKAEQQLKGLKQNDYQNLLLRGRMVFSQNPGLKASSVKQKLDSIVRYTLDDDTPGKWIKDEKEEYSYDANGKWTKYISYFWSETSGQWVGRYKNEFAYNTNDEGGVETYSEWNTTSLQWDKTSQFEYIFDTNSLLAQILTYKYDKTSLQWVKAERDSYTYNTSGKCTLILIDELYGNNQWINENKYEYTYDANGRMITDLYSWWDSSLDDSRWRPRTKYEYTYNSDGKVTTEKVTEFETFGSNIESVSKYDYTYDSNGNPTQELKSTWETSISDWVLREKAIWTYDLSFDLSDLIFPPAIFKDYDVYNKPLDYITYSLDETMSNWEIDYKSIPYYSNQNGTGISEIRSIEPVIYPSHVSEGFYLKSSEKNMQVSIYNLSGTLLFNKQVSGDEYINVSTLSKGIYLVKIATGNKAITKKFIKK